jgi:hypothetical protein
MTTDNDLRQHLLDLLGGRSSGTRFDDAVADFPPAAFNQTPPNLSYTPWQLLEHLRLGQRDILDYVQNAPYVARKWPDDYWPPRGAEADEARWAETLAAFRADQQALQAIIANPEIDLLAPMAHTPEHTVLREVLLATSHNAYHIGEFAALRAVMGTWPPSRGG